MNTNNTPHTVGHVGWSPDYKSSQMPPVTGKIMPAIQRRLVHHLESCKYWQEVSECDCDSPLPQGGCLRCDMDKAVELLTQIVFPNTKGEAQPPAKKL